MKNEFISAQNKCLSKETNDCPETSLCVNRENDFTCVCKDGYYGDGWNCTRIPGTKYTISSSLPAWAETYREYYRELKSEYPILCKLSINELFISV